MTIEIVDLPIKNGGSFHSFLYVYQRVPFTTRFQIVLNSPVFAVFRSCFQPMQFGFGESLRWAPSSYVFGPSQQLLGEGPAPSFHRTRAQLQHGERRRSTGDLEMKWMNRRAKNGGYNRIHDRGYNMDATLIQPYWSILVISDIYDSQRVM